METIRSLEKAEDCSVWSLLYAGVLRRNFYCFLCVLWLILPGGCSGRYTKGLAMFGSKDCWVRVEDLVWCESLMQDIAKVFWNLLALGCAKSSAELVSRYWLEQGQCSGESQLSSLDLKSLGVVCLLNSTSISTQPCCCLVNTMKTYSALEALILLVIIM